MKEVYSEEHHAKPGQKPLICQGHKLGFAMKFKRFIPGVCDKAKEIGCGPFVMKAVLSVVDKLVLFKML